jgi:hypothetical protein
MALDPTAREANVRDSLKRYLVTNLKALGIPYVFDRDLTPPRLQGEATERWVSIVIDLRERDTLSIVYLDIFCCTRKDNEGFRLAQLTDSIMGLLTDTEGPRRIPFYKSHPTAAWEKIGGLVVQRIEEYGINPPLPDGTKVRQLSALIRFASRI